MRCGGRKKKTQNWMSREGMLEKMVMRGVVEGGYVQYIVQNCQKINVNVLK